MKISDAARLSSIVWAVALEWENKKYGVTGSWTQGLVHAKHALYQLSYNPVMLLSFFIV